MSSTAARDLRSFREFLHEVAALRARVRDCGLDEAAIRRVLHEAHLLCATTDAAGASVERFVDDMLRAEHERCDSAERLVQRMAALEREMLIARRRAEEVRRTAHEQISLGASGVYRERWHRSGWTY